VGYSLNRFAVDHSTLGLYFIYNPPLPNTPIDKRPENSTMYYERR
jgi:hypothetical protein